MSITTYNFHVELLGTSDPIVSRAFTIPAFSTFERLNYAIQAAFNWSGCHMHEFTFEAPMINKEGRIFSSETCLSIGMEHSMMGAREGLKDQESVRLRDVWEDKGKFHDLVTRDGEVLPLIYMYDFGDSWEHVIRLVSRSKSSRRKIQIIEATGCGPLDDSGSILGWESIKAAFASKSPDEEEEELIDWARDTSGEDDFNPNADPELEELNQRCRGL